FYDIIVPRPAPNAHAVDRYQAVLPFLRVPSNGHFQWLPSRPQIAATIRQKWQIESARWLVIQPGARWLNKRWPAESFAHLVRRVSAVGNGLKFATTGGPEDQPLGALIAHAVPDKCLDLTGRITLLEMVEWLRLSEAMVTNDTGPMHVAAALNKPIVAL